MQEFMTTVTRKGQITVPVEIRRSLGLKEGDKVAVSIVDADKRQASLRPVPSVVDRVYGSLPPRGKAVEYDETRSTYSAFGEAVVEEWMEEMRRDAESGA